MAAPLSVPRPSTLAKQARAISAAQHLFLERGYVETSMDAVALEARVSKQTLYTYYPSKAELFAEVPRAPTWATCSGTSCPIAPSGSRRVLRAAAAAGLARPTDPHNTATLLIGALVLRIFRDGLLLPPGAAVPRATITSTRWLTISC